MADTHEFADWLTKSPHRPPNVTESNDTVPDFLQAIGRLTVTWETTETQLAFLFQHFCSSKMYATVRAYGSIVGSSARCDMLKAAAEAFYGHDEEGLKSANYLIGMTRRIAACRNTVVHSMLYSNDEPNVLHSLDVQFPDEPKGPVILTPASYATNKTGMVMAPRIGWNVASIDMVTEQAHLLSWHVHRLTYHDTDLKFGARFRFKIEIDSKADSTASRADDSETSK